MQTWYVVEASVQRSGSGAGVRPPVPPFDEETARQKVKAAQDAWNTRDPEKVSLGEEPEVEVALV